MADDVLGRQWEGIRAHLADLPRLAEVQIEKGDGMGYTLLLKSAAKLLESHAELCNALSAVPKRERWLRG